jgi:hypothetical protein
MLYGDVILEFSLRLLFFITMRVSFWNRIQVLKKDDRCANLCE